MVSFSWDPRIVYNRLMDRVTDIKPGPTTPIIPTYAHSSEVVRIPESVISLSLCSSILFSPSDDTNRRIVHVLCVVRPLGYLQFD